MLLNYYDEIILEIKALIKDKNYEDAYLKCFSELKMPYIPKNVEFKLIELFKQINVIKNKNRFGSNIIDGNINNWTLEEIESILLNPLDEEIHLIAFQCLKSKNINKIMKTIRDYLKSSLYSNENKIHLLFLLKEHNINEMLEVKKTNGVFKLNPNEVIDFYSNKQVKKIFELLDKYLYNDPSLYNICLHILQNYYYVLYPYFVDKDEENDFVVAIIYKAHLLQFNKIRVQKLACKLNSSIKIVNKYLKIIEIERIF